MPSMFTSVTLSCLNWTLKKNENILSLVPWIKCCWVEERWPSGWVHWPEKETHPTCLSSSFPSCQFQPLSINGTELVNPQFISWVPAAEVLCSPGHRNWRGTRWRSSWWESKFPSCVSLVSNISPQLLLTVAACASAEADAQIPSALPRFGFPLVYLNSAPLNYQNSPVHYYRSLIPKVRDFL